MNELTEKDIEDLRDLVNQALAAFKKAEITIAEIQLNIAKLERALLEEDFYWI